MVSALGILPFDLYSAGYGEIWFLGLLALSAVALALWGSVLTWWLIAAPALWWIEAVPSGNINDTLTDVFFLVLCLVLLTRKLLGLRKPKGHEPSCKENALEATLKTTGFAQARQHVIK